MPLVEERVNTDPDYADLRAVYTARVAAEYIRQQDAKKATDFRKIINSDDVAAWPLRDPHQDWNREQVWNRYMDSIKKGIEWFELKYGGKVYNQGVGGVDFSRQPKRNIPKAQFTAENRDLDNTVVNSRKSDDASYRDLDTVYLGAGPADDGNGEDPGGDPKPTPTPTPSETGKPTDPPSSPAPDPTTPGDDGTPTPPGNKPDPDGDLADTGSSTPVGLFVGIAAALAAAGGALMWWMRRRRTTVQE